MLFFIGIIILFFGITDSVRDYNDQHWPSTDGVIRSAKIFQSMDWHNYYAAILYDYKVAGFSYSSSRVTFGDFWYASGRAASVFGRYPQGKSVTVFYNPSDPQIAVLETGFNDRTWTMLAGGVAFILWGTLPIVVFSIRERYRKNDDA